MTLSEFKAWFEGFSEGIDKAPTEKQFAKIKAKVAEINGAPVTERVYIDRYVRDYRYWQDHVWGTGAYPLTATYGGATGSMSSLDAVGRNDGIGKATAGYAYIDPASKGDNQTVTFDSHAAMRDLGRAEAVN